MTVLELKARAYDLIAALEALQRELSQVNQQIAEAEQQRKQEAQAPKLNHTPPLVYDGQ